MELRPSCVLKLDAPIDRWDEAVPLGNGLVGALLWGDDSCLRVSLDRADLWDLRVPPGLESPDSNFEKLKELVARRDHPTIAAIFEEGYEKQAYPTKLPGGRLEFRFSTRQSLSTFELDSHQALGRVQGDGLTLEAFCCATEPVGLIAVAGSESEISVVPPAFGTATTDAGLSQLALSRLEYPAPESGRQGNVQWARIRTADTLQYAIVVAQERQANRTLYAFTIAMTTDGSDPVGAGKQIVLQAISTGYERLNAQHLAWWSEFWSQSSVRLPDPAIEQHYQLAHYYMGSASRLGRPPMALQGVWTADEGTLPPWKGDYHNDLNTQMSYWSYATASHLDEGLCLLEFNWNLLPSYREYARNFFGVQQGAAIPGAMSLNGQAMGGWIQYAGSPTNGAWVAQTFYLHWRYTMQRDFLRQRAYPFCREIGEFLQAMLKPGVDGKLKLPLSSSPEIHDNRLKAFLTPNSHYDLSLMRWLFGALAEMAQVLNLPKDSQRWQCVFANLDELAVSNERGLMLSQDEQLEESHRHFSHLMAIYPLGTLTIEDSERHRQIIEQSLYHLDCLGTAAWCGYSFGWLACMAARCGKAEKACHMLRCYLDGFISRNGFHLNGDYKDLGLSLLKYRPFTLEGNFAAAQAVHEMLLQSWGGKIRIFPAIPSRWQEVSFQRLRAEGAFRVSAVRQEGRTTRVKIEAETDCLLVLQDPFDGQDARWSDPQIVMNRNNYHLLMKKGQFLEGCRNDD